MTKENIIEDTMEELNKKYGKNSIIQMNDKHRIKIESISTNCYSLDEIFGCGGLPRGRIIELFGEESSGKSTMAAYIVAQVQKQGGKAVWIDVEHAFSTDYAEDIGVNIKDLILSQPSSGEEALDMVDKMAKTDNIDIIVLDSVAALVPQKELEGEITDSTIALQARMMSQALRMITGTLSKTKTTVVFINQMRDKVGVFWGNKTTTSGGKALKFYASVRLEVKKGKHIKDKDENVIGNWISICGVKNKVGFPFKKCELELIYKQGVDIVGEILDIAIKRDIIKKDGNTYVYEDKKLGVGRDQVKEYLKTNIEIFNKIKEIVYGDIKN
jgi:recombination protein RecA